MVFVEEVMVHLEGGDENDDILNMPVVPPRPIDVAEKHFCTIIRNMCEDGMFWHSLAPGRKITQSVALFQFVRFLDQLPERGVGSLIFNDRCSILQLRHRMRGVEGYDGPNINEDLNVMTIIDWQNLHAELEFLIWSGSVFHFSYRFWRLSNNPNLIFLTNYIVKAVQLIAICEYVLNIDD